MFALWQKHLLLIPLLAVCRHLEHKVQHVRMLLLLSLLSLQEIKLTCHIIIVTKGFTLKTPRETVGCPAALFLLVSLLCVWDVDGLARRHICNARSVVLRQCS